jgi:vacuolar iron transporter family protein
VYWAFAASLPVVHIVLGDLKTDSMTLMSCRRPAVPRAKKRINVNSSKILPESHRSEHIGWLRAAVLGANDGIVSTASLIVGVAAANSSHQNILLTGIAGLVAGAMSMAAGEYVSVSSQADTEKADLAREKVELSTNIEFEKLELAQIYIGRGLEPDLATKVAEQLMAHDALGSHARDELGITDAFSARPIQAAFASAGAFSVGAALPLLMVLISNTANLIAIVSIASLGFLIFLGVTAAFVGGASVWRGARRGPLRASSRRALAMAITAGIGSLFGTVV